MGESLRVELDWRHAGGSWPGSAGYLVARVPGFSLPLWVFLGTVTLFFFDLTLVWLVL